MSRFFTRRNMANTEFREVNLAESTFVNANLESGGFDDVNLAGASFHNVNLAGATIHSAYLKGLVITDANIEELTVNGFRIDLLIEEQLNRRDPLRRRFKAADITDPSSINALLDEHQRLRSSFAELLRSAGRKTLTKQPQPAEWSPLLILRHLVYAEELFTNRLILDNDLPFSGLGLLPDFLQGEAAFSEVGTEPTEDLELILAAWDHIHRQTRKLVASFTTEDLTRSTGPHGTVGRILQNLALHDLEHIRDAEAMLRGSAE